MSLLDELDWRGFVHQTTHPTLGDTLAQRSVTLYCGFDPTADSLHIGSLLPIMGLAHFQRAGHRPVVVVGGGTGLIGDPSGKASERSLLTKEQVTLNVEGIRRQLERFVSFDGPNAAVMTNNADWLCALPLVDFLRDTGKHFSVNVMLAKESVRARIEDRDHGMSFTEFTYSLLQAYDYLHLHGAHGCTLQVGGSDQWGNIVAGIDLIRRLRGAEVYGLTFPLVTKSDGSKFGKSEGGNIWLDPARTEVRMFRDFWISVPDEDAPRYLRYFTFLSREEIEAIERASAASPESRIAQQRLADEVTRLVHGEAALEAAKKSSDGTHKSDHSTMTGEELAEKLEPLPPYDVALPADFDVPLVDVLVASGIFSTKGEVRRLIQQGGLSINGFGIATADCRLRYRPIASGRTFHFRSDVSGETLVVPPDIEVDANMPETVFVRGRSIAVRKGKKTFYHFRLHA